MIIRNKVYGKDLSYYFIDEDENEVDGEHISYNPFDLNESVPLKEKEIIHVNDDYMIVEWTTTRNIKKF